MNNYQDWAQLVAKKLEHESMLLGAIDKDELDDAAATEAFVRAVLRPFLPENYGIGSGRVVDAYGNYSDYLDIIVFNQNYPRIGMRGTHSAYLYESVLAAFAIRAKFVRKSFADALDACASLADLETAVDKRALRRLAAKNGLKAGPNHSYVHQDPLRTARFELIGRPLSFVFGFSGFKFSHRQLQENIELWIDNREKAGISTAMKCLPAVIATQGCFAWRNAAPLALKGREMLGIGNDDAPVRLIVLQLLYLLNRRLQVAFDGYGLKPSLDRYLSHFSVPKFEAGVGNVAKVVTFAVDKGSGGPTKAASAKSAARPKSSAPAVESRPSAKTNPAAESKLAAKSASPAAANPTGGAKPAAETGQASAPAVESRPSAKTNPAAESKPAAKSAPPAAANPTGGAKPAAETGQASAPAKPAARPESKPAPPAQKDSPFESSGVFDKPSPFASKPKPETAADNAQASEPAPRSIPSAPLGSAPIPQGTPSASTDKPAARAPLEPAKPPPLDITLDPETPTDPAAGAESSAASDGEDWDNEEIQSTMIITPDASLSDKEKSKKSGDEFIAQVKKQMSSPEPIGED